MADRDWAAENTPYWQAFKEWVCSACLDCRDDGECGLPRTRTCALKQHLPLIVETAHRTKSRRVDDYLAAIENRVCTQCPQQDALGVCAVRDHAECALNSYLSLVLDAIDDVDQKPAAPAP
jgi:hypothetical protein